MVHEFFLSMTLLVTTGTNALQTTSLEYNAIVSQNMSIESPFKKIGGMMDGSSIMA